MKRLDRLLIGCILLLAAWPRFYDLNHRGAFYHDEALTLQNGRYYGGMARTALHQFSEGKIDGRALTAEAKSQWDQGGSPSLHARPLHEGAVILIHMLGGTSDTWALMFSAVCGIISVFLLAVPLPNRHRHAGMMAALLLALSAWHIHYSRAAASMSLSVLMALLTLRAVLKFDAEHPEKSAARTGFWSGLAMLSHYNLLWLPLFAGFGAFLQLRALPWQRRIQSLALLAGASLVPAFLLEGLWRQFRSTAGWALRSDAGSSLRNFSTYFEQLYAQVFNITTYEERHPLSPLFLPRVLLDLETVPFFLVLVSGFAWLAYRTAKRDVNAVILLAFALIPGLLWSLFGYHGPRSFIPILPVLCLGAGELGALALNRARGFGWTGVAAFTALAAALLSWQGQSLAPLIQARSPWKEAAGFLEKTRPGLVFADAEFSIYNRPLLRYYLGNRDQKNRDSGSALILDPTAYEFPYGRNPRWERARAEGNPFRTFDFSLAQGMVLLDPFAPDFIASHLNNGTAKLTVYIPKPDGGAP